MNDSTIPTLNHNSVDSFAGNLLDESFKVTLKLLTVHLNYNAQLPMKKKTNSLQIKNLLYKLYQLNDLSCQVHFKFLLSLGQQLEDK